MKAVVLQPVPPAKPGEIFYPLQPVNLPTPEPSPGQVQLRILAASLNHRDLFQRRGLYPGTAPSIPLLADGYGIVTTPTSRFHKKRVLVNPAKGWLKDPRGPENAFAILGGTKHYPNGTLQEYAVFDEEELVEAPSHLSAEEAAALPLCGLTAWRATMTKGQVEKGDIVLITGIGGGVALMALLFAVRKGARVFVTSSNPEKIERAKKLGAEGGVLYTSATWEKELAAMAGGKIDAVIDGAGGDIVTRMSRVIRDGGRIVSYGMTLGPSLPFSMAAVLRNVDLLGSTMGSRKEFTDMVEFVAQHGIRPVISRVVTGMDVNDLEGLWDDMEKGKQFGKLVVKLADDEETAKL
ncbi:Similar to Uncharacterized zinc-type alcohol dehydrogenase-like protein YogA; acc. no. O35017 [Pyronema omphalodes CBS 100304]|uniref:Similar to Uncharacterized zinc-type alcohol dehydrogenase-like protein YogA acc. no. O35017 n=1 Tax=Pyronema omphalodes (strain CBS 100304) TaxID=1076935 RepID=U4L6R5_PYROM|nr:Similar to Uncharacterized zinc-type alcohol dehydrogenase-like protein YogA; acc. no. O35017 [Pyronema omphalodes CBS 100304]